MNEDISWALCVILLKWLMMVKKSDELLSDVTVAGG